jgi:hypothetical protein
MVELIFTYLFVQFIYLFILLFIYLFVNLFIYLFIYLFMYLFIYLFIYFGMDDSRTKDAGCGVCPQRAGVQEAGCGWAGRPVRGVEGGGCAAEHECTEKYTGPSVGTRYCCCEFLNFCEGLNLMMMMCVCVDRYVDGHVHMWMDMYVYICGWPCR